MKKSLASCSPEPDWEHFQKIRLKQKAMEQINLDWISQRKKKQTKNHDIHQTESFSSFPEKKLPRLPVFSWQTCTGVHAGNVLQAQLPKILLQAPVNFGVTFRPGQLCRAFCWVEKSSQQTERPRRKGENGTFQFKRTKHSVFSWT